MDQARIPRAGTAAQVSLPRCRLVVVRTAAAAALCVALIFPIAGRCFGAQPQQVDSMQDFRQRLQSLAVLSPDPCGPRTGNEKAWGSANSEYHLFSRAEQFIIEGLNAPPPDEEPPKERAARALRKLEAASAEVNASWPDDSRFHFQILDLPPALIVKVTIRTDARYFVFGIPDEDFSGKGKKIWKEIGSGSVSFEHDSARSLVELFTLHRGPSGNARFLAKIDYFGCAGSTGIVYDARQWDPAGLGELRQIIKQDGALGLDDKVSGFPQVGQLRTEGSRITLQYCWFSPIDTWDNPSLCAVDTYDLSGDNVRFRSHIYNRPDLLPVAKALEYAEQRDYSAVLGYCASSQLAHRLVREAPPHLFAEDVRVTRKGNGKERVELGGGAYRFDVERRAGRWLVVAFDIQ